MFVWLKKKGGKTKITYYRHHLLTRTFCEVHLTQTKSGTQVEKDILLIQKRNKLFCLLGESREEETIEKYDGKQEGIK